MSSRFVDAWKASPAKLLKLVGTKQLSASDILNSPANKRARKEVFMTLGQGDEREDIAEGKGLATTALTNLLEKRLDREDEYGRVTELILNHVARPLGSSTDEITLGYTYHVPNDEAGCWNPFLRALKLPTLAKLWASDNFPFPRAKGKSDSDWPMWFVFDVAALAKIAAELAPLTRAKLDALPAKLLTDDPEDADDTRDELWQGLKRLRDWVKIARAPEPKEKPGLAKRGNSLILVMDGDQ